MKIHESAEDYLEAILALSQNGFVRSIDIAHRLGYSKPSVSNAMKALRESNDIVVEKDGIIVLTKQGEDTAKRIYERHLFISEWLISIGVAPDIAAQEACRIEHDISEETFEKLKKSVQKTD